jgi:hypothetical protein
MPKQTAPSQRSNRKDERRLPTAAQDVILPHRWPTERTCAASRNHSLYRQHSRALDLFLQGHSRFLYRFAACGQPFRQSP